MILSCCIPDVYKICSNKCVVISQIGYWCIYQYGWILVTEYSKQTFNIEKASDKRCFLLLKTFFSSGLYQSSSRQNVWLPYLFSCYSALSWLVSLMFWEMWKSHEILTSGNTAILNIPIYCNLKGFQNYGITIGSFHQNTFICNKLFDYPIL